MGWRESSGHISVDPNGPLCGCGMHGCWETLASSSAALRFYEELAPGSGLRSVQELLHKAEDGDSAAMAWRRWSARRGISGLGCA